MSKYKMYIKSVNGVPSDDWTFSVYLGAKSRELSCELYEDINNVPISNYNIIVGPIEDTKKYFEKLNVTIPEALNIPECLIPFTGRYVLYTTMKGVREGLTFPFFIKPQSLKKFIPAVVENKKELDLFFNSVSDNEKVLVSGKVEFVSEYRCFINKGKIIGIKHYIGDYFVFPNIDIINKMVEIYENEKNTIGEKIAPISYSLDVGITNTKETLLVELTDAWSLDNYGLDPILYSSLLLDRWFQIINK